MLGANPGTLSTTRDNDVVQEDKQSVYLLGIIIATATVFNLFV